MITLPLNFLLTHYAHGIVLGVQSDAHEFAPTISSLIQVPSNVILAVLTIIVPLAVLSLLVIRKRFFDLLHCVITLGLSGAFGLLVAKVIEVLDSPNLDAGYRGHFTWIFGAETISIPGYIAYAVGLLIILGPRSKEKFVNSAWVAVYACIALQIILGTVPLMSAVLAVQIGFVVGLIVRFTLGQSNSRLSVRRILKSAKSISDDIIELVEEKENNQSRKRVFIASGFDGAKYKVVVFDSDKQALNIITRFWQFLKFKNIDIKYTTSQTEFEHTALMNYAINSAGMNYPKLLGATFVNGSTVFVFDGLASEIALLDGDIVVDEQIQTAFWDEIHLAHKVGITYHKIDITDLKMYNFKPAIWEPEDGEIASDSIFKHLDTAQLFVALAILTSAADAVKGLFEHIEKVVPKKNQTRRILQIASLLDRVAMPPMTKLKLKKRQIVNEEDNLLAELKKSLQAEAESRSDTPKVPIRTEYKRFSVGSIISLGLTIAAVMALLTQLDFDAVVNAFTSSNHLWAFASFAIGFLTFLGGALALKGFGAAFPVKVWKAFQVQIAAGWSSVQLPAGIGPLTMNVRYLGQVNTGDAKKHAQNTAVAGVVQVAQVMCSTLMLFIVGILSGQNITAGADEGIIVVIIAGVVVFAAALFAIIPKLRRILIKKVWPLIQQFIGTVTDAMKNPKGVVIGFIGCLTQEMGYALSLWAALLAFNQSPPLVNVILVFLIANAAGAATPTPGGLGAYEAALTLGLGTIGIPATVALSCTLLWRVIIFWVRAPMGAIMQKYLEKKNVI